MPPFACTVNFLVVEKRFNILLYRENFPFRREVGLSLARIVEAENQYIKLWRVLSEEPGTILAQEMETLRSFLVKNFASPLNISEHLIDARERFARRELETGLKELQEAIGWLLSQGVQPHCRQILTECQQRMREFGQNRLEYPLLAIVVMEKCKKQEVNG